jgi:hypothetical protein
MSMNWPPRSFAPSWLVLTLGVLFGGLSLGASPALAQEESSLSTAQKKKLRTELQQTYKEGAKAGNAKNFTVAAARFEESVQLAQKLGLSDLVGRIEGNLVNSLKGAGSAALQKEQYGQALSHYKKLAAYTDQDPSVRYNQGLALINMDSTRAGLQTLRQAIELGTETGNTRVAGLATERIRDEFLASASKALQGDTPSQAQIVKALNALDQMREYVDPSAKSMFYRALALFQSNEYQQSIQTAREGLEMHQGSRSDAAKYYYVIGESQFELGSKADACQTFQNASYGDYEARANHYLKNECDDV